MTPWRPAVLFAALATVVAACGDAGTDAADAWSRGGLEGQNSAVYMDLSSGDGDTLTGVSVSAAVAADAQLHETVMADSDDDMEGMTMQPVDELVISAGDTITFEPGGYHVMLIDLVETLAPGDAFDLTLRFDEAGEITVEVDVRDE